MANHRDESTRKIRNTIKSKPYLIWSVVAAIVMLIMLKSLYSSNSGAEDLAVQKQDESIVVQNIIDEHGCPCGCGRFLPGSSKRPACFGCSVGKSEVSNVLESLSKGRTPSEIASELNEPVLIDVFSDYTDENLSLIWKRAKRVAAEFNQHRVVLRTPGLTEEARLAIKFVDCARLNGKFSQMQEALIMHQGPWSELVLMGLAIDMGIDEERMNECLIRINVGAQIAKDRQHAEMRRVMKFPAISVNQKQTATTDSALHRAIQEVIIEGSI